MLSHEPGMNLGTLVAANRNALAAIETSKKLSERLQAAETNISRLQEENQLLHQRINALQLQIVRLIGSGATG